MIFRSSLSFVSLLAIAAISLAASTGDDSFKAPDSLQLKDGRNVCGLIVKNTVHEVVLQEEFGESTYQKKDIVRIRDEADIDVLFTDVHRKGDLPSWRVIANDLRTHDTIKSLIEVPATAIDNGPFKNVPYKSFRVNKMVELNIYGDPNDPAGIEFGIYGGRSSDEELRKVIRAYLAGFLTTRAELAALYAIPLEGGKQAAGDITVQITPKTAPDAYGAWWISLYNKKDLAAVRLSDAAYAKLTKPVDEVVGKNGEIIAKGWARSDFALADHSRILATGDRRQLRGFYRDEKGEFRLLTSKVP